jgi:hypothetical protein
MRMAYLLLEISRRLAAQWFCSRLCMTFPFLFSFCFGDDEGHSLLLGLFLFFFFASRDCEEACGIVISLSSVYNLPLFLFLLFRWWWRSRLAGWVLRFSGLQGAIEDDNISVGFLGLLLVLVSVLWISFLCLFRSFFLSPFARSPLLSLYRASGNLGGGNGWPPKCSVTDTFNEENVRVGYQRTKRLCL